MKLTVILFLVTVFCAAAEVSYSQVNNISLDLENVTLEEALDEIKQKGAYSLWYRNEELNLNKRVSLHVKNQTIRQVLDNLLTEEDIAYLIEDRHIIIYKKDTLMPTIDQQTKRQITGIVTDENGEPVIGASIVEKGTTNGIVTDMDGKFSLSVSENAVLQFSYIGYITQEVAIGNQVIFNIQLLA